MVVHGNEAIRPSRLDLPLLALVLPFPKRMNVALLQDFEAAVVAVRPHLHRVAMRWLRNAEDAEDAVQCAFLQAYTHLDQFEHRSQLSTWMHTILVNLLRMNHRRKRRFSESLDATFDDDTQLSLMDRLADAKLDPEQIAAQQHFRNLLYRSMDTLPLSQRTALILYYDQELKITEIAARLGLPEGTVKCRLARGKKFLRNKLAVRAGKATAVTMPALLS
jgi:RNA polymerase sigma-70 factor (ECF subfamily)